MNDPLDRPKSRIARLRFDFVQKPDASQEHKGLIADSPAVPIPSRPWVQTKSPDININLKEPIWKRKRRQFWQCGQESIWRTPLLIAWYCAVGFLLVYELWLHLGPGSERYRHDAAIYTDNYFAAHGVIFPMHDVILVSSKHAGWRQSHLETSPPSLLDQPPPDLAPSFLDTLDFGPEY